jgi:hypothetical protein
LFEPSRSVSFRLLINADTWLFPYSAHITVVIFLDL